MEALASSLFQWATGLTLQGSNLPFALPQRVDRLPTGFAVRQPRYTHQSVMVLPTVPAPLLTRPRAQLSLLQRDASGQSLETVATISAEVEEFQGSSVLVVSGAPAAKLEVLVDVPVIMGAMPQAIKRAVFTSRPQQR